MEIIYRTQSAIMWRIFQIPDKIMMILAEIESVVPQVNEDRKRTIISAARSACSIAP